LLFPVTKELEAIRLEEQAHIDAGGQHPIDPTVFWIKQTVREPLVQPSDGTLILRYDGTQISNACGTIGL
jgi:hypothetical protein